MSETLKYLIVRFVNTALFWVVPPKVGARDTCLCVVHENMRLMIIKLYSKGVISQATPHELINSFTCSIFNEDCLSRKCTFCKNETVTFLTFDGSKNVIYEQWISKKETRVSAKTGKNIEVKITFY